LLRRDSTSTIEARILVATSAIVRKSGRCEKNKPCEWLVKPNQGHGFYLPENRLELFQRMITFLDKHIGKAKSEDESVVQNWLTQIIAL